MIDLWGIIERFGDINIRDSAMTWAIYENSNQKVDKISQ